MLHDPHAQFQHRRLSNGLDVYVLHLPERSWACVGTIIYGGAYADPVGKEGSAHLVEHLMAKYRTEPESSSARQQYLEDNGLISAGFMTGGAATIVEMKVIPEAKLHRALETLAEFVFDPLPWERLEAERCVVEQEFQRSYANLLAYETSIWPYRALAPAGRWARSPSSLGTLASIRGLTREDLEAYRARWYVPRNMACMVVGKYTMDEVCVALEATEFIEHREGVRAEPEPQLLELAVGIPSEPGRDVSFSQHGLESVIEPDQCGYSAVALMPNTVSLLTMTVTADLMQQELFDDLRGIHAWTYGVDVSLTSTGIGGKLFSIYPELLKLEAYDRVGEAVQEAIMRIRTRPETFERLRRRKIRQLLMADLNLFDDLFEASLHDLANDRKIFTLQEDLDELQGMTHEQVVEATQYLVPERLWTLRTRR